MAIPRRPRRTLRWSFARVDVSSPQLPLSDLIPVDSRIYPRSIGRTLDCLRRGALLSWQHEECASSAAWEAASSERVPRGESRVKAQSLPEFTESPRKTSVLHEFEAGLPAANGPSQVEQPVQVHLLLKGQIEVARMRAAWQRAIKGK